MPRRPTALNDFVGQHRVISELRDIITGARSRSVVVPSLCLVGPSGAGKTMLAQAIAREWSATPPGATPSNLKRIFGGRGIAATLVGILAKLEYGDILFIDETHAVDRKDQELLYAALDDHKTFALRPNGSLDRSTTISIAEFTLVAATTEPGGLAKALRTRLHSIVLDPYKPRELKEIAERIAAGRGIDMTAQAARHLAERSQQTPRSLEKLLKMLALTVPTTTRVTQSVMRDYLDRRGIDEHGFDPLQRQLIDLLSHTRGHTANLTVITAKLGVDKNYIRADVEPLLLERKLIDIGPTGRTLTASGIEFAAAMKLKEAAEEPADTQEEEVL